MSLEPHPFWLRNPREQHIADRAEAADPGDERKTTAAARTRSPRLKVLEAGPFAADISSFGLHLAAEEKALST